MNQKLGRMTDKSRQPTEEEIFRFIGEPAEIAWRELTQFIKANYDFNPETIFYGAKYGWTVRYRRSGKTLCSLFPEKDGFTVLIVLGKKEVEKALRTWETLSSKAQKLFDGAGQLRDGRWLWIRLLTKKDVDDIKKFLRSKRRPKTA